MADDTIDQRREKLEACVNRSVPRSTIAVMLLVWNTTKPPAFFKSIHYITHSLIVLWHFSGAVNKFVTMHLWQMSLVFPYKKLLWLLDPPFYERSILCFARFFLFFPQLTFSDVCKPTFSKFETFPHDVALLEKEALLCRFIKSAPNKNEGRKPQISPNLVSNRNILCAVTRNVEGK